MPIAAPTPEGDESLRRDIGQKIVTRMAGERPSTRLLYRVYRGEVGGVILFARNASAPAQVAQAVTTLQQAAARGGNPRLLIAVDQEGGDVRRLPWAPPDASAAELGADPASAFAQGELTGRALRRVGINLDLAPVLDVPAGARELPRLTRVRAHERRGQPRGLRVRRRRPPRRRADRGQALPGARRRDGQHRRRPRRDPRRRAGATAGRLPPVSGLPGRAAAR